MTYLLSHGKLMAQGSDLAHPPLSVLCLLHDITVCQELIQNWGGWRRQEGNGKLLTLPAPFYLKP